MGRIKAIKAYLKQELDPRRYDHTLGVVRTAERLARRHVCFGSGKARKQFLKQVRLAALLHDADKTRGEAELRAKLSGEPRKLRREFEAFPDVWHAYAAAVTARERFGLHDKNLLRALRYHTTGRPGMSPLEKIIYLADYIEPGRDFPGLETIRQAAWENLDRGCLKALEHSIAYLEAEGALIAPQTIKARKDLLKHGIY